MARELTPAELGELLGAYALDAIADDDERAQVTDHLERVPAARDEVAELREVAALLGSGRAPAPPAGVWERIEAALEAEPPRLVLPFPPAEDPRARRGVRMRVAAALVAASAAAAAAAFVITDAMSDQEDRLAVVEAQVGSEGLRGAALAAMADPHARMAYLEPDDGGAARAAHATVVAMPDGAAYLMAEDLPVLAPGRTYQLWAMTGDDTAPTMLSAAILGPRVDVVAFRAPEHSTGFVLTEEQTPGVTISSQHKVLSGTFA